MAACNYPTESDTDRYWMPKWVEPLYQGSGSFKFVDYKSRFNREGRSANCPMYYEFKSCDAEDEKWQDVVKINPSDAVTLGVQTGDWVKITMQTTRLDNSNKNDYIYARVKVTATVKSGVVAKCYGQGHWAYGRLAKGRVQNFTDGVSYQGGNNNEIIPADWERIGGGNARNGIALVTIEKVDAPYRTLEPIVQFRGY
jgi:anaerobic selenocysteine-containing dehydrogenase